MQSDWNPYKKKKKGNLNTLMGNSNVQTEMKGHMRI